MYDFIDITESQTGNDIPSEAINVNGEYIEEHLPGYRTLYTEGREICLLYTSKIIFG